MRAAVAMVAAAAAVAVCAAAAIPGGVTPADVAEEPVRRALDYAVTEMNVRSNSFSKLVVTRVVDARKQVVAGIKFTFTFEGGLSAACPNDGQLATAEECPVEEQAKRIYNVEVLFQPWTDALYQLLSAEESVPEGADAAGDVDTDAQPCNVLWTGYAARADGNGCEWVSEHGCDSPSLFSTEEECLAAVSGQADGEASDDEERPQKCQMVFVGFEYDAEQGACVEKSFRGCANPFEYLSAAQCQDAHAQPTAEPCLVQVSGWEYDADAAKCIQRTLIDCSANYPFEYATEQACLDSHPTEPPAAPIGGETELVEPLDEDAWQALSVAVHRIQQYAGDHGLVLLRLVEGRRQLVNGVLYTFTAELAQSSACAKQQLHRLRTAAECPADDGAAIVTYRAKIVHRPWSQPVYELLDYARSATPAAPTCMAIWHGYVFNEATRECEARTTTGCHNPFPFVTLQECQESSLLPDAGSHIFIMPGTHEKDEEGGVSPLSWVLGAVALGAVVVAIGAVIHIARRRRVPEIGRAHV